MSWTAGPRYLLRRYCIMDVVKSEKPRRVLEIGCGAGDTAHHFALLGCDVYAVDMSAEARQQATARTEAQRDQVTIAADLPDRSEQFDMVVSFEVLEHIEDDKAALADWSSRVAPEGQLLISVPCHQHRWGPSDVWAGHFRRYEREELTQRLAEVGFEVELLWCYGFPLANMAEPIREWLGARRLKEEGEMTTANRTARSGVERRWFEKSLSLLVSGPLILPFHWIQKLFLNTERGNGYLVLAKRAQT